MSKQKQVQISLSYPLPDGDEYVEVANRVIVDTIIALGTSDIDEIKLDWRDSRTVDVHIIG